MRQTRFLVPTLREVPAEAELKSHVYLLRAGYMRKLAAGIYSYLPLGWRVLQKIEAIIRQEMDAAGAQEVLLPAVQPAELWKESGRWSFYGPELLRFKDRKGSDYCVGPTHEEVITALVRGDVRSWRQLPLNLYQIQTKFRDEMRPRAGLLRGREFTMKDAYSFDADEAGAHRSYQTMYQTYRRIFTRCGLDFRPVEADTGNIGGSLSHEFQVLCEAGEDTIVTCASCDYAANLELAEVRPTEATLPDGKAFGALGEVPTPGKRTVEEVTSFLEIEPRALLKTVLFRAGADVVAVLVRGDHEVAPPKVKKLLGLEAALEPLEGDAVQRLTGAPLGFAGPVGLRTEVTLDKGGAAGRVWVAVDHAVKNTANLVAGANKADTHLCNVNFGRDFKADKVGDVRMAHAGDRCARCGGELTLRRSIEVGHVFFLGTKYSAPMRCVFLDEGAKEKPMVMGCYGIGVTRIAAAAIEQHHDQNGIAWPLPIAPFAVHLLPLQMNDPAVTQATAAIEKGLAEAGVEVLVDDRDERPGVKFKDADLVGVPVRVAVGARGAAEGVVELKLRAGDDAALRLPDLRVPVGEAVARVRAVLAELAARTVPPEAPRA